MADEEDEENAEFTPRDALIEWERIPPPRIRDQFHSPSQSPPLSDHGRGIWSTVDEYHQPSVVFPPVNHEGIHHHQHHHDVREIDIERVRPPSPISRPHLRPAPVEDSLGWWDEGLEVLRFKLVGIVSYLRNFSRNRRALLWSVHFPMAGSIILLLLLYTRFRRRQRRRREVVVELIRIIKEKDERIHQLLYQIARMNEVLLATHHGVSMISKASSA